MCVIGGGAGAAARAEADAAADEKEEEEDTEEEDKDTKEEEFVSFVTSMGHNIIFKNRKLRFFLHFLCILFMFLFVMLVRKEPFLWSKSHHATTFGSFFLRVHSNEMDFFSLF